MREERNEALEVLSGVRRRGFPGVIDGRLILVDMRDVLSQLTLC